MNIKKNQINLNKTCLIVNKICSCLNTGFYINSGGCCYIAYLIAQNLESLNIKYEVCISGVYSCEKDLYYTNIKHRSRSGVFCYNCYSAHHIWIKINNKHINGERNIKYISLNLNSKDLLWMYKRGLKLGNWNNDYDIKHNTFVKRMINLIFKNCE